VGEGIHASFDKKNRKRLQDLQKLDTDVKEKLYFVMIISSRTSRLKTHWHHKHGLLFKFYNYGIKFIIVVVVTCIS